MSLSERQAKILGFIREFMQDRGFPPTIREIGEKVGISSTSVVNYNLDQLEKKKLIQRDRRVSRGLRLIEPDEGHDVEPVEPEVPSRREARDVLRIPLVGRIAAGKPVPIPEASADFSLFDETVELAYSMLSDPTEIYALQVQGQSMIDALIDDGDIVLMRRQDYADNGDMVAALLLDSNETTLKRIYREKDRIRLQPANPTMEPIYVDPDNVRVQGKVVMVIRDLARS